MKFDEFWIGGTPTSSFRIKKCFGIKKIGIHKAGKKHPNKKLELKPRSTMF